MASVSCSSTTRNGFVVKKFTYGNTTVYLYLPKNLSGSSSIDATLFYPGVGGYAKSGQLEYIAKYYSNNASLPNAFLAVEFGKNEQAGNIDAILEYIRNNNGIDININNVASHSMGGMASLKRFSNYLSKNPDADPVGLTLYDPYDNGFPRKWGTRKGYTAKALADRKDSNGNYIDYDPELMRKMRENGSAVRVFAPGKGDFVDTTFFNSLARNKIPTVIISNKFIKHAELVRQTTKDKWQLYLDGVIELDKVNNYIPKGLRSNLKKKAGYKITLPIVAEDGTVTWKTYNLTTLQAAYKDPDGCSASVLAALDALEASRVGINFNYLDEFDGILKSLKAIEGIDINSLSYTSDSSLLGKENKLITTFETLTSDIGKTLTKEINAVRTSEEKYLSLENDLRKDCELLDKNIQELQRTNLKIKGDAIE